VTQSPGTAYKAYIICTSPRSGSTLLCKLLAATGCAGNPKSYFHEPSLSSWLEYFDLDQKNFSDDGGKLTAIVGKAKEQGTAGSGIFGLRLQRRSFGFFASQLALLHPGWRNTSTCIEATFGKTLFIHLTRGDKLAQAVSLTKAMQTGLWHRSPDGTEIERLSEHCEPEYDADMIGRQIDELNSFELGWKQWFTTEQIKPLTITYDELAHDPVATLSNIFGILGLDPSNLVGITPPVAILADSTNAEWISRYRRQRPAAG
jgi:trehalose 2-sulfotransferase